MGPTTADGQDIYPLHVCTTVPTGGATQRAADDHEGSEDGSDTEVPHAPSPSQPAAAETDFLLQLDFENTRFSMGDVLSALDHSCGGSSSTRDSAGAMMNAADEPRPESACGSEYVVVTEEMSQPVPEHENYLTENGLHQSGVATDSLRRAHPYGGVCPPAWRHAMYVSALVWPAQQENGDQHSSQSGERTGWTRWCGFDLLSRTFGFRRT